MALNFNVDPYYDDFDPSKNFHRILFKPGFAVQARELTQSQTIIQSQISKFADNIFKQNTPVTGGKVTTNLSCAFIKLNDTYLGSDVIASRFLNKLITNTEGTVIAKVIATSEKTGTDTVVGDPPTLIVTYQSGIEFTDDNLLRVIDEPGIVATTIGTAGGTTCTGLSSVASVSEGVFYVVNGFSTSPTPNEDGSFTKYSIGNFVSVQPQTVILDKYDNFPSVRVGLLINESIVDAIDDSSLLDPAIGASNYQAPGSDRYKIFLDLITLPLAIGNDDQFIELLRVEGGQILKQVDGTVYSVIDDYFAKRDYETNGDYIVNDFKLTPTTFSSEDDYYNLNISKGLAYVQGYRIDNQGELNLTNRKARDTNAVIGNNIFVDYGNYFYVDTVHGLFDVTILPQVDLHCVVSSNVSSSNANTYNSTLVGTGLIRNLTYVSDTSGSNTLSYVFKSYISDIDTKTLSANATGSSTSTTINVNDALANFSSSANAYVGATILITKGTSAGDVRKVTLYDGTTKTFTVDNAFTLTPDATTQFNLILGTNVIESVVQRSSNSVYTVSANSNINTISGKQSGVPSGDTLYFNPTTPELLFKLGDSYISSLSNTSYFSTKVFRSKTFTNLGGASSITIIMPVGSTLRFQGSGALGSDAIKQLFTVIDTSTKQILDFSNAPATVTITGGGTSATFVSAAAAGKTVNVIVNGVFISSGDTTNFVLKSKSVVSGNTSIVSTAGPSGTIGSTYIDLPNGQVYVQKAGINLTKTSLYVTDVKSISKIIDTLDPAVVPTVDMLSNNLHDVTNSFVLNNGQKDTYYDHASLSLSPGANPPKGNILVIFDYYGHSGGDGYFSVRSYLSVAAGGVSTGPENYAEIGTYISNDGTSYSLRDSVDFRPTVKNAQPNFVFDYTGNPSTDDTGILIPDNLSSFISNYQYYLSRKDKLILTKDKEFQIINGSPAINAILPVEPAGSLVLAELNHDPYTAYIPGQNPVDQLPNLSVNKVSNRRWTMNDITGLQTRIENLEYYTALNLLEQSAQSLQIPDSAGLNRFKNGILVDDFSSYSVADTYNQNFASNINVRKKRLSPITDVQNFQLQNPIVLGSLGTIPTTNGYRIHSINNSQTNIFTLPYTTQPVVTQPLASNILSVNPFSVIDQQGTVILNPPVDNWIDSSISPSSLTNNTGYQIFQAKNGGLNVINAGDFASVVGVATLAQNPITSASLTLDNGYYINNNILPYIRNQQILVRAKGLLSNSPIKCWFDGTDVSKYVTSPNIIRLTGVVGKFKEDDIVGFYYSNKFFYVGKVVSVYNESTAGNIRLSIMNVGGFLYAPAGIKLQNAQFNNSGVYSGTTASGTIATAQVQSAHRSGTLSGVGGTYTANNIVGSASIYKVINPNSWGTFLNQYGVWGDLQHDNQGNSTNPYSASFVVNFPTNGQYTFTISSSDSATTSLNASTILTTSNPISFSTSTQTITAGNSTVSWAATNASGPAGYAMVIKNSDGNIIFQSDKPTNITYGNVSKVYGMTGGGYWFTGATQIQLDPNASANTNFYVGSNVHISSTYVTSTQLKTSTYVPPPPPPPPETKQVENRVGYMLSDMLNDQKYWGHRILTNPGTSPQTFFQMPNAPGVGTYKGKNTLAAATIVSNIYRNYLGRKGEANRNGGGVPFWTAVLLESGQGPFGAVNEGNILQTMQSAANAAGEGVPFPSGNGGTRAQTAPYNGGVIAGDLSNEPDRITYSTVVVSGGTPTRTSGSYTYSVNDSAFFSQPTLFTANIIAYNATTKVATLDTAVNISLGYNSKLGDLTSTYSINGNQQNIAQSLSSGGVPTLSTDENGTFTGIFNVPPGTFSVGQKVFRIDNRRIINSPDSATTFAEATFFSAGLYNKSLSPDLSPSFDSSTARFTQVNDESSQLVQKLSVYTPRDPVAQTFLVSEDNFPNGTFISSIKLFFASKPGTNVPITVSIVGTLNSIPNGPALDNSTVTLNTSEVNTSQNPHYLDSSTYTEFVFPAPVYIRPGILYAILVKSSSSEYFMYIAKQKELALSSTSKALPSDPNPTNPSKIGTIPYIGNLFESQNSITWVPNQTADLMMVIERCFFQTNFSSATIPFQLPKNMLTRKLVDKELQFKLDSNTMSNLYGSFLVPIQSHEYNVTTTDFIPTGTSLSYTYQSLYDNGGNPTLTSAVGINPGKFGCPTADNISLNDGLGARIINPFVDNSFSISGIMATTDNAVTPIISDDGVSLYNIRYAINDMGISNNIISVTNGGSGYNVACTYATISAPEYGTPPNLGVEIANGSVISVFVQGGNLGSGYIKTPTIQIIDANNTPGNGATAIVSGETSPSGGNAFARYITKKVSLTPQNESGDLRVFTTAYYPVASKILVYYKILNSNDTQNFDSGNWQLMTQVTNANIFSKTNTDLIEFQFAPGINGQANNQVSYVSSGGQTYNSFNQFAIKIVFATSDNTVIPFLSDLRVLAVPSGTGN